MLDIGSGHIRPIGEEMKTFQILIITMVLAGCASGPSRVVGQVRPAIEDYTTVTILAEMPEGAEQIAVVKVKVPFKGGFSHQEKIDYAIEELQQQAAKVGANAFVIDSASTDLDLISTGPRTSTYNRVGLVQGVAVWVD